MSVGFVRCRQNDTQICCVGDSFFMCRVAADMQFWANLPTFAHVGDMPATCRRHSLLRWLVDQSGCPVIRSFVCSRFIRSFVRSLVRRLFVRLFVRLFAFRLFVRSLVRRSFVCSLFVRSFVRSFVRLFIRSFVLSFVCSRFVHLFARSFELFYDGMEPALPAVPSRLHHHCLCRRRPCHIARGWLLCWCISQVVLFISSSSSSMFLSSLASLTPVSGIKSKMLMKCFFFAESTVNRLDAMVKNIPLWIGKDGVFGMIKCCGHRNAAIWLDF